MSSSKVVLDNMSNNDLMELYEQLMGLNSTGVTDEQPLRGMIDAEFEDGNTGALLLVLTNILMEIADRYYKEYKLLNVVRVY